ncbi:MAG TPA: alpha/beta fold hydrolase [Solirubrobacteraceae bacterium]|nr:alpha/beta fold hydrolase [Solirubrobacteraceae bacterium]
MPDSVVLLHGFSGTRRAWDGVIALLDAERYRPLALDLPGHGDADDARQPITFADCVQTVLALAPERFTLCGYSLGGRVALHIALAAPEHVSRLVLVSCSAGIEDPHERASRREADDQLARDLEREPFEAFIDRWRTQPLFAGEPPSVGELARADQRRNDPEALAAVLRGLGAGAMEPLWGRLGELSMPVTVIAGARDVKYVSLGQRMVERLPAARLLVVEGGHGLVLENPAAIAHALA